MTKTHSRIMANDAILAISDYYKDFSTFYYQGIKYIVYFRIFVSNNVVIMLEFIKTLTVIELIIWIVFLALILFQLFYQLFSYRKLLFYKAPDNSLNAKHILPPISVIICAKNEARNLEQFLPLVLEQDYPDFQVIVVNDCSDDRSEEVLKHLCQRYKHLYFTNVKSDPIYRHGKKLAITLGIKAAKHEHLIFTDADCYPNSKVWLRSMAKHYVGQKNILIGLSPYESSKGLLGQVIAFETLQTAISYVSSALRQRTYMGVGRNMGYTKSVFYDNNGFSGHTHLLSGDDDLFINKAATEDNVAVELSHESHVKSLPETCWEDWYKQKRRHLSTGKLYKPRQKVRFAVEGAQGFLFYSTFIALLLLDSYPFMIAGLFLFRFLTNSMFRTITAKKMHLSKTYFFQALWLDIIVPVLRAYIMLINIIKPQKFKWR